MGTKETGLLVPFLCVFRGLWFYFKMQIQPQSNRHKEEKTLEPRALAKIRNGRAGTEIMPAPVCHAESRGRGDNTYVAFCWRTTGFVGYFSITPQSCSVGKRSILWFDTASRRAPKVTVTQGRDTLCQNGCYPKAFKRDTILQARKRVKTSRGASCEP